MEKFSLRTMESSDISKVTKITKSSYYLETHSPFVYWVLSNYFRNLTFIAHSNNKILGFVSSVVSSSDIKLAYIWQIGVDEKYRRKGIGKKLLNHIFNELKYSSVNTVEFSISPNNVASIKLFEEVLGCFGYEIKELEGFELAVDHLNWQETNGHFRVKI